MHTIGPWVLENNKIKNKIYGKVIKAPSFIIMKGSGSVYMFGEYEDLVSEMAYLKEQYLLEDSAKNIENYELIQFFPRKMKLKIDEVCTVFNLLSEVPNSYNSFIKGSKGDTLKSIIKEFAEKGY